MSSAITGIVESYRRLANSYLRLAGESRAAKEATKAAAAQYRRISVEYREIAAHPQGTNFGLSERCIGLAESAESRANEYERMEIPDGLEAERRSALYRRLADDVEWAARRAAHYRNVDARYRRAAAAEQLEERAAYYRERADEYRDSADRYERRAGQYRLASGPADEEPS